MKNLLLITSLLILQTTFAQSEYNYQGRTHQYSNIEDIVYLVPAVKNKTVQVKTTRANNKKVYHYEKTFNEFAKMTEQKKIKKDEVQLTNSNTYDSKGKVIARKSFKNGKLKSHYQYVLNEDGRRIVYEKTDGKGKLKAKSTWEYMPNAKCLKSSVSYKKDGTSTKKMWNYEYYGDCEKKQSTLTDGKGKVLKTWTYDCKKEGEELTKKKGVNQICKWEETDDNYLIKVQQNFDEKGKIIKMVSKYRSADTSLVSYKRYNSDNELINVSEFNPDTKKVLSYKFYKKGELRSENIYKYDGERILASTWIRKGKEEYKSEYIYNDNKELIEMKSFNNKMKQTSLTTLAYK